MNFNPRDIAGRHLDALLGQTLISDDDPAEAFHVASNLYRRYRCDDEMMVSEARRDELLERSGLLPGKQFHYLPRTELPTTRDRVSSHGQVDAGATVSALTAETLGTMLFAAYGRVFDDMGRETRTVPSGGRCMMLDVYVVASAAAEVPAGLHRYAPEHHCLQHLVPELTVVDLAQATALPAAIEHASCVVVLGTIFWRGRLVHGLRGHRLAFLEAGHAMQNLILAGDRLGVDVEPEMSFYDEEVARLLRMDSVAEAPLYIAALRIRAG